MIRSGACHRSWVTTTRWLCKSNRSTAKLIYLPSALERGYGKGDTERVLATRIGHRYGYPNDESLTVIGFALNGIALDVMINLEKKGGVSHPTAPETPG